jgi:hypothetical protein
MLKIYKTYFKTEFVKIFLEGVISFIVRKSYIIKTADKEYSNAISKIARKLVKYLKQNSSKRSWNLITEILEPRFRKI